MHCPKFVLSLSQVEDDDDATTESSNVGVDDVNDTIIDDDGVHCYYIYKDRMKQKRKVNNYLLN